METLPPVLYSSSGVTVVSPLQRFLERTGYPSWPDAVAAMKEGKVLVAPAPFGMSGKSMMGLMLFTKALQRDGLMFILDDIGQVAVGIPEKIEAMDSYKRQLEYQRLFKPQWPVNPLDLGRR